MRRLFLSLAAGALAIPMAISFPQGEAVAKSRHYRGTTVRGHRVCSYSKGTTGLVAGGVGGAVVGSKVLGGPVGAIAGAVGGAVAGRAIDRASTERRRCYYR